jgi:Hydrolytic ATP binding site of dynein motor region
VLLILVFVGQQTVLDALRARKERFVFEDVEVTLKPTVMAFITMNPGYPGRAELPESLKVQTPLLVKSSMSLGFYGTMGHHAESSFNWKPHLMQGSQNETYTVPWILWPCVLEMYESP